MSMNQYELPPDGMQPPPRSGMNTTSKVLIILAVVFGGLMLVCCGGVMLTGFYAQYYLKDAISEDPVTVAKVTGEIVRIDVPEGLDPAASFNMDVPFSGQKLMTFVVYTDEETNSALFLASMGDAFNSQNQEQMRQSMGQQLQAQGMGDQEDLHVEESRQVQVEIRGQTVTFTISKGTGKDSQTPRVQVTGAFQGESGPVMLILNADAEKFPEERLVEMIESIE